MELLLQIVVPLVSVAVLLLLGSTIGRTRERRHFADLEQREATNREFLVTDLFPADITDGMQVLLIYKGPTLQEYVDLKEKERLLVESGSYEGTARAEIAREMGRLLSYPEDKITSLLTSDSNPKVS